jgi:hypothetical protein
MILDILAYLLVGLFTVAMIGAAWRPILLFGGLFAWGCCLMWAFERVFG